MLTFNKGPYASDNSERLKEQEDEEAKLLKRGGSSKGIYQFSELEEIDWLYESVKISVHDGEKAKYCREPSYQDANL